MPKRSNPFAMSAYRYLLFFLAGLTVLASLIMTVSAEDYSLDDCTSMVENGADRVDILACFTEVAVENNDPTACEYEWEGVSVDRGELDECYLAMGSANNNIDVCYSIADLFIESECVANVAMGTGNIDLCEDIERNAGHCLFGVAVALQDVEICSDNWSSEESCRWYIVLNESSRCVLLQDCYDAVENRFTDLLPSHDNYDAIWYLREEGVIGGYDDGSFKPGNTVNRAELLKILVEGQGITPDGNLYKDCFNDVGSDWYAKYVCYAKEEGWVDGYDDGTFKPGNTVNKVEALKMLLNAYGVEIEYSSSRPYDDVSVAAWYGDYVVTAKELGILEEVGSFFNPGDGMKRAGVCENLYRLLTL